MSWLGVRTSRRAAADEAAALEEQLLSATTRGDAGQEPALLLLAADAAGFAARRVHVFAEAQAAERFVHFWYPEHGERGLLAYWLLPAKPGRHHGTDWGTELLLLVRDSARRGVVYAFSFTDWDDVREFLAGEVERGLDLASVLLFWVVPGRIHAGSGGSVALFPAALPEGMAAGNSAVTALAEKEMTTSALRPR